MKSDFRDKVYNTYLSQFKKHNTKYCNSIPKSHWQYYQYKYMPLLNAISRNSHILELGCGQGYFLEMLKKNDFLNIRGVDISEEQICAAKERGLDVELIDAFDFLKQKEEAFDAIIAMDFVEHFNKDEIIDIFIAINKALKSGGIFIIQTPNGQGLQSGQVIYGDFTHLTIFSPESLHNILHLSGFIKVEFIETGPAPIDIKGIFRVMVWKFIKLMANFIRVVETGKKQKIWTENVICYCQKPSSAK